MANLSPNPALRKSREIGDPVSHSIDLYTFSLSFVFSLLFHLIADRTTRMKKDGQNANKPEVISAFLIDTDKEFSLAQLQLHHIGIRCNW